MNEIEEINLEDSEELKLIDILGEPASISNKEFSFFCPKCDPPHHKPKLFVNRETFKYHCFVCGFRGNSLRSLSYNLNKKINFKKNILIEDLSDSVSNIISGNKSTTKEKEAVSIPDGLIPLYKNKDIQAINAIEYLKKRDIHQEDILKLRIMYGVGFDSELSMRGRIVFPSFDSFGDPNFFVGRATWEKPENSEFYIKYKHGPYHISPREIIFNELNIDWNYPIVLAEGPFDAARIENSVPLLGKSLTVNYKIFREIIKRDVPVILCLDSDAKKEQIEIASRFSFYGASDIRYCELPEGKDPAELSRNDIRHYLNTAKKYKENNNLSLVERIINDQKSKKKASIF